MRIAYLYSRYPVVSQASCVTEMLEMERRGDELLVASAEPPLTSQRPDNLSSSQTPVYYPPPAAVLRVWQKKIEDAGRWPSATIERHDQQYGPDADTASLAREAGYFAELFSRRGIEHLHVHFLNRAAHMALFVREMYEVPFSISAHGQGFVTQLQDENLLQEICAGAKFIVAETDYSRDLLRKKCPDSAPKIHRVYEGLDLSVLPALTTEERAPGPVTILSVGNSLDATAFEILLEACAELDRRNLDFRCQIVGKGPGRERLKTLIAELNLRGRVTLCGSLPHRELCTQMHGCDIFALPFSTEDTGYDAWPVVIQEAMACGRPIVSTRLGGIPELIMDGTNGFLVPPGDWEEFSRALERLVRDSTLRTRLGTAGRHRMENDFAITKTIEPLRELLHSSSSGDSSVERAADETVKNARPTAYLIEKWPNKNLPLMEMELRAMRRNAVPLLPFVLRPAEADFPPKTHDLVLDFQYLPDAMVIEAEWQRNQATVRDLEAARAEQDHRAPSDLFLEQARAAFALRALCHEQRVGHVHATCSRTLICALVLRKLLGVTVSVAIEEKPVLSERFLAAALDECAGGRSINRELLARRGSGFLFDEALDKPSVNEIGPWITRKAKVDWAGARPFWEDWSRRLKTWAQGK